MQDLLANSNAVIGVWMIVWALIMKTSDILSSFAFKVIPFFMGAEKAKWGSNFGESFKLHSLAVFVATQTDLLK